MESSSFFYLACDVVKLLCLEEVAEEKTTKTQDVETSIR